METGEITSRTQWNPQQVLLLEQGYKETEVSPDNPVFVKLDERELIWAVMSKTWQPVTVWQVQDEIQEQVGRKAS